MLKISLQLAYSLLFTGVNDSKVVSSGSRNNKKLTKSNFIKPIYGPEEYSFLTLNTKQIFT